MPTFLPGMGGIKSESHHQRPATMASIADDANARLIPCWHLASPQNHGNLPARDDGHETAAGGTSLAFTRPGG